MPFCATTSSRPKQRDPALFAANFQSFWNLALDDVWTAIHTVPLGDLAVAETRICPLFVAAARGCRRRDERSCARTVLATALHMDGKTLALNAPADKQILISGLRRHSRAVAGQGRPRAARRKRAALRASPLETATIDSYLANDCASAAPCPFSPLMTATGGYTSSGSEPRQPGDPLPQPGGQFFRPGARRSARDLRRLRVKSGELSAAGAGRDADRARTSLRQGDVAREPIATDARRRVELCRHPRPMTRPRRTSCRISRSSVGQRLVVATLLLAGALFSGRQALAEGEVPNEPRLFLRLATGPAFNYESWSPWAPTPAPAIWGGRRCWRSPSAGG